MKKRLITADIIVVGGGISGTVAAIAAARQGTDVILVEKGNCLGGLATSGLLGEMNGTSIHGQNVLPAIGLEILERMTALGAGLREYDVPMTSNPDVKVDRFRYNGEYLKIVLDEMAQESGVRVLLSCLVTDARELPDGILLDIANAYETLSIKGNFLIDSTGNSECIYHLGGETAIAAKEQLQAVTTMFRMGGVDIETFLATPIERIQSIINEGQSEGILPARILAMLRIPGTRDICVNCTRKLNVNHESMLDMSDSYRDLRHQIKNIVPFIQANVPGCEHAYLNNIAASLGVRDRRKTLCDYELTGDDLTNCVRFEDTVACGVYPIDIHKPTGGKAVTFQTIGGNGIYKIPLRCMIPKNLEHVLVNGKGLDADDRAFGAFRTMGALMNIATAAGTAAAQILHDGSTTRTINVTALQEELRRQGVVDI